MPYPLLLLTCLHTMHVSAFILLCSRRTKAAASAVVKPCIFAAKDHWVSLKTNGPFNDITRCFRSTLALILRHKKSNFALPSSIQVVDAQRTNHSDAPSHVSPLDFYRRTSQATAAVENAERRNKETASSIHSFLLLACLLIYFRHLIRLFFFFLSLETCGVRLHAVSWAKVFSLFCAAGKSLLSRRLHSARLGISG